MIVPSLKGILSVLKDDSKGLKDLVSALADKEVLVGFPEDTTERKGNEPTNASIAYIHDNGAPEANIPQRQFMIPGISACEDRVAKALISGAKALARKESPDKFLHRAGLIASTSIKRTINAGIPPPLSEATLRKRANRGGKGYGSRKGAKLELELRDAGWAPSVDFAKPLVDTGQLRNAVTYVIRRRKAGKR